MAAFSEMGWQSPDGIEFKGYHITADRPKGLLALVHGLGEHSGRYKHMARYFADHGYAFAAFDLRGHGRSGGQRGHTPTYNTLLDDVAAFLSKARAFYPDLPVFLYGHSMGGNIVLNYWVKRQPQDLAGIITSGAFIRLAFEPSALVVALARFMRGVFPKFSQKNQLVVDHISRSPEVVEAYKNDPLVHNRLSATLGIGLIEAARMLYGFQGHTDTPMLIMHGGADKLTSPKGSRQFAENVSGDVTYKEWPGLYHELHNEPEKQQVFDFVLKWMNDHLPAT